MLLYPGVCGVKHFGLFETDMKIMLCIWISYGSSIWVVNIILEFQLKVTLVPTLCGETYLYLFLKTGIEAPSGNIYHYPHPWKLIIPAWLELNLQQTWLTAPQLHVWPDRWERSLSTSVCLVPSVFQLPQLHLLHHVSVSPPSSTRKPHYFWVLG